MVRWDGSGLRRLTDDAWIDRFPRWSPDGEWIAFHSNRETPGGIWRIRPDGSDLERITDESSYTMYPVWSPDSRTIVASRENGLRPSLFTVGAPRAAASDLAPPPDGARFIGVGWSADGRRLSGVLVRPEGRSSAVYDFGSQAWSTDYGDHMDLSWLPDGRDALAINPRGLSLVRYDTAEASVVVQRPLRATYSRGWLTLAPSGTRAVSWEGSGQGDVWSVTFEESEPSSPRP